MAGPLSRLKPLLREPGARAMAAEPMLPPPGRWALGSDAQAAAEALVLAAQRAGLRTGWLAAEAGFLSNLNIEENLRLMHDWDAGAESFAAALARAQAALGIDDAGFLLARPAALSAAQLLRARLLRLVLHRPALVVLAPALLAQAGALAGATLAALAGARLLLLGEADAEWPAWPPLATVDDAAVVALTARPVAAVAGAIPGPATVASVPSPELLSAAAVAAAPSADAPAPDAQDSSP